MEDSLCCLKQARSRFELHCPGLSRFRMVLIWVDAEVGIELVREGRYYFYDLGCGASATDWRHLNT